MLDRPRMIARFARDMPGFLREPLDVSESRRRVEHGLASREESFLRLLAKGVYSNRRSPYARLLTHLGVELGDLTAMVRSDGVEGALEKLYDEGVSVSLDEFKGRRPYARRGLEIEVREGDFDNPLNVGHLPIETGGSSTGVRRRMPIDFSLLGHAGAYEQLVLAAFGIQDRPGALWYPLPPGVAGITRVLMQSKMGTPPVERWFTQTGSSSRGYTLFTRYAIAASRLGASRIPRPEHTPPGQALRVADWLAEKSRAGTPGLLWSTPSSAVRVCSAAREGGLDIAGSVFRVGGEPYTGAKARVLTEAGCRGVSNYYMTELGQIGLACAAGAAPDDTHVASDSVAVLRREPTVPRGGMDGEALVYTTIHPRSPKLLINVESGDRGTFEERECSCPLADLGLHRHLHSVRSYDKLATEGMNFLGSTVLELVEEVLPGRFGGGPTDYQFVEEEREGQTSVVIAISPRVDGIDEARVVEAVLAHLGARGGPEAMMADVWQSAGTLRVLRRDPHVTTAGKTLPLHTLRD